MPGTVPALSPTAEDRLSALLDAAVDAIVLIDPRGRISRFNRAAERLFGYVAAEVLGQNVSMLMPGPYHEEHDGYLERYANTGRPRIIGIGREVVARRKDGSTFPIDLSVGEFRRPAVAGGKRTEDGGEHGFVGILRDITARKAQEQQLRDASEELRQAFGEAEDLRARLTHAGRLGTLGEMVSGIAHEVNQPLTAIANYASACKRLLLSGRAQPEEMAEVLDKISVQAERAGQVIRGLRKLARREDRAADRLDVNQLVGEVARLVEFEFRNAGWQLRQWLAPDLPQVSGDGVQVQQVVLNLLRNAVEAMAEATTCGDTVDLSTRHREGWVEITVDDCGPGIPVATAQRLFEPFFTTKPQGMGLGLSICKSIISAHGGELRHEPRDGGGSRFRIRLPAGENPE
jgi:two-component system sensor kinase FixL